MEYKDIPWNDIVIHKRDYTVFKDKYPVTEGHILFVPKNKTGPNLKNVTKQVMVGVMNGLKMDIVMLTILDKTLGRVQV